MSQRNVERVIGLLATDEQLRRRFTEDPHAALSALLERGLELTACELRGLAAINPRDLMRFAEKIDPCLQRTEVPESAA